MRHLYNRTAEESTVSLVSLTKGAGSSQCAFSAPKLKNEAKDYSKNPGFVFCFGFAAPSPLFYALPTARQGQLIQNLFTCRLIVKLWHTESRAFDSLTELHLHLASY